MGKIIYDFREGLDKEKIIYRNTSCDWASFFKWIGSVLLVWIWMAGWFAVFQYSYINHAKTAFWVYCIIWLTFMICLVSWLAFRVIRHYRRKSKLKKEKELLQKEKRMAADTENKYATKPKNELDVIELQNLKETENAFFNSNK